MREFGLFLRLTQGGGRRGAVRLALMTLGMAIGVLAILVAVSIPRVLSARTDRANARNPLSAASADQTRFTFEVVEDVIGDRVWTRVFIADPIPGAPTPPGVGSLPEAGSAILSPALVDLVEESDADVDARLPSIAGSETIGSEGLSSPDELISYEGVAVSDLPEGGVPGSGFGPLPGDGGSNPLTSVSLELLFLIGGPAVLYLITCSRLSAATRQRRIAALRLIGMSRAELLRVSAWETALAGTLGAALGAATFNAVQTRLGDSGIVGLHWFAIDAHLSTAALAIVVVGLAVASALLGEVGARRAIGTPIEARRGAEGGSGSWPRLVPLVFGTATLLVLAALTLSESEDRLPTTTLTVALFAGGGAALAGLIIAIRPVLVRCCAAIASSARSLPVRLGARRAEYEPAGVVRLLTGLVLLFVISGTAVGVLRDLDLSSGSARSTQLVSVDASYLPVSARDASAGWPSVSHFAIAHTVVTDSTSMPTAASGSVTLTSSIGVDVVWATCEQLRALMGSAVDGCLDGHEYRLVDEATAVDDIAVAAGVCLPVLVGDGGTYQITTPEDILRVNGLFQTPLPPVGAVLVTTATPQTGGWSADTVFVHVLAPGASSLAAFQREVAALAPAAHVKLESTNLSAFETYRVHRASVTFGVTLGFCLALLAFLISAIDRAIDRRRAVASLIVLGTRVRTIRLAHLTQLFLALGLVLLPAALVGFLAGNAYLGAGGLQHEWVFDALWTDVRLALLALILAALAGWPVIGRKLDDEVLRRE